ncbi:MAG: hypothetical protein LBT20_01270 [Clostridiales bacterium]|jgi:membrane protein implicated in regulation of membrane protease activity|nr:hypothetical protein [Clostridiales bacterium]
MKIFEKLRDAMRAVLYTVTFRLLFTVFKGMFRLFIRTLYAGFFYLFFYVLFGVVLWIFFGFVPVFWDLKTKLYAVGFVFWTLVSVAAVVNRVGKKLYRRRQEKTEDEYLKYLKDLELRGFREARRAEKLARRAAAREKRQKNKTHESLFFADRTPPTAPPPFQKRKTESYIEYRCPRVFENEDKES